MNTVQREQARGYGKLIIEGTMVCSQQNRFVRIDLPKTFKMMRDYGSGGKNLHPSASQCRT